MQICRDAVLQIFTRIRPEKMLQKTRVFGNYGENICFQLTWKLQLRNTAARNATLAKNKQGAVDEVEISITILH